MRNAEVNLRCENSKRNRYENRENSSYGYDKFVFVTNQCKVTWKLQLWVNFKMKLLQIYLLAMARE